LRLDSDRVSCLRYIIKFVIMNKILYIFLTLSILSVGCSKEDDPIQLTQETPSDLDQNLYGIWKNTNENTEYITSGPFIGEEFYQEKYYHSFTSNGQWNSWTIQTFVNPNHNSYGDTSTLEELTGVWWSQDNYIFFVENVWEYSISGNTLTLTESEQYSSTWTKQ